MTEEATEKPVVRGAWSRRDIRFKIPPEAAKRQGLIIRMALESFATKDEAIAYLNGECIALAGRPLDLATHSHKGLEQVIADLSNRC
ncbi:hypothetical protein [Novosphingobium decolorationis]|uniref:Antitoxin Xre/MbcA/ParS-like toxin-binding domain-containing protein n=1 Tax=Novosphingobium decolorationis TaxID=2698673 RepID=A0ABX8E8C7_9SPHN|nr:hypothetical protein [Novosphingobium decolorationis]QVM85274.1 hypothetical protein HT578_17660 [Novosphingobium decolorationis]